MNIRTLLLPVALVVSVVVFVWMIKPEWSNYKMNKENLVKLQEEERAAEKNKVSLEKYVAALTTLDQDVVSYISNALPKAENSDDFIAEINKYSSQSSAMIDEIAMRQARMSISECESKKTQSSQQVADADANNPIYCPKEKVIVGSSVQLIGSYLEVKDFLDKIDISNRIISPKSIDINKVEVVTAQSADSDNQSTATSNLVKAKVDFDIYYKEKDEEVKLSQLNSSDKTMEKLLTEKVNQEQIEKVQDTMRSELFIPVTFEGAGKSNIFE